MSPSQIVQARWFPTVTKPILAGLITAGILVGLRALGVTDVVPSEVNTAATALASLLVTAIVQMPERKKPAPAGTPSTKDEMLGLMKQLAHEELDANPDLIRDLAVKGMGLVEQVEAPQGVALHIDGAQVAKTVLDATKPPDEGQADGFVH